MAKYKHYPVLLKEINSLLTKFLPKNQDLVIIDSTFGEGHYSRKILSSFPSSTVHAIDTDSEAYNRAMAMKCQFRYPI